MPGSKNGSEQCGVTAPEWRTNDHGVLAALLGKALPESRLHTGKVTDRRTTAPRLMTLAQRVGGCVTIRRESRCLAARPRAPLPGGVE